MHNSVISAAREVAFKVLCRIELHHSFSDYVLHSPAVARLEPIDRRLVTEIVYGTLRWKALLDYIAAGVCARPWDRVDPKARILLRMSVYQMRYMDRIPDHALVNDAVEIAKKALPRGATGFINGVLRQLARTRPWRSEGFANECPPWVSVSLPEWLWERWTARFGDNTAREFALSLNETPIDTLRLIPGRPVPPDVSSKLIPSDLVPGAYVWNGSGNDVAAESVRIQDEASQLIPHLLGDITGWQVWDSCAAPGGKSAILQEACGDSGLVVASDVHFGRAARLRRFLELSSGRAVVLAVDAEKRPPFGISFDAVVVDAPCSGLGTLRRNPEIKWSFVPERLEALRDSQAAILSSAATVVRQGGFLLYSTCSTEPEENEEVINGFLDSHPNFRLIKPEQPPGVDTWLTETGFVKTFPGRRLWDGFFAGLMLRES